MGRNTLCISADTSWLLNTLIFWFGTNVQAFIMMFTSYDTKEFTLQNFTAAWELFTTAKDANLSLALLNTTKFFLVSFFTIPIPYHHGVRAV